MSDDVQHLLASTVEPIPEEKINLNLPSSLQLEEDTQGSERHIEKRGSFKTPVVHEREHRRSSSSSAPVESSQKRSQEETSSLSENSRSPHSNRGPKHE